MQDGPIPAGLDMQVAVTLEKPVRGFLQKNPRTSGRGAVSPSQLGFLEYNVGRHVGRVATFVEFLIPAF